jgi:glycosyltransferase involved in cell wall biosynthesis
VILFLHHRYRTLGGEERAVQQLSGLVSSRLGEPVRLVERDSSRLSPALAAAGLLRGGRHPEEVADAVRESGARIVHAHNLQPTFGWRALAAAREAGARTVLHLHNYRLVCAVATCVDPDGRDCLRCHGCDTRPGVRHGCRGSRAEGAAYAVGLSRGLAPTLAQADAIAVPSEFARDRLLALGAPLRGRRIHVVPNVVTTFAERSAADRGTYALVTARLAPEKGVEVAIDACRAAGVPLVVASDGPQEAALRARAAGADVRFAGRVPRDELDALRAGAALELVPSRAAETFGLAAVEAMAAGVPVVASRVGAMAAIVPEDGLVPPGDVAALTAAIGARYGDAAAGTRGIAAARAAAAPERAETALRALYDDAMAAPL